MFFVWILIPGDFLISGTIPPTGVPTPLTIVNSLIALKPVDVASTEVWVAASKIPTWPSSKEEITPFFALKAIHYKIELIIKYLST